MKRSVKIFIPKFSLFQIPFLINLVNQFSMKVYFFIIDSVVEEGTTARLFHWKEISYWFKSMIQVSIFTDLSKYKFVKRNNKMYEIYRLSYSLYACINLKISKRIILKFRLEERRILQSVKLHANINRKLNCPRENLRC